jgi:hypothetical protein
MRSMVEKFRERREIELVAAKLEATGTLPWMG